jgi:uncharacterized protein
MTSGFQYPTEYFLQEGKTNIATCLQATFAAALAHEVGKVIIFTSAGRGVLTALDEYSSKEQYSRIQLIAVTFPSQSEFTEGDPTEYSISVDTQRILDANHIPVVRAHLPFHPIRTHFEGHGVLGQDLSLVGNALRIFGGGMSLCVQAVLMASDAGFVKLGEHVLAMTSDTSILVRAAGTARLLTDLIVREVICKPVLLTVSKAEKSSAEETRTVIEGKVDGQLELEPPE